MENETENTGGRPALPDEREISLERWEEENVQQYELLMEFYEAAMEKTVSVLKDLSEKIQSREAHRQEISGSLQGFFPPGFSGFAAGAFLGDTTKCAPSCPAIFASAKADTDTFGLVFSMLLYAAFASFTLV